MPLDECDGDEEDLEDDENEELEREPNQERDAEVEELADPTRIASMAFGLGLGRPSVRLEPK